MRQSRTLTSLVRNPKAPDYLAQRLLCGTYKALGIRNTHSTPKHTSQIRSLLHNTLPSAQSTLSAAIQSRNMSTDMTEVQHGAFGLSTGTAAHIWRPQSKCRAVVVLQHGYAEYAERYITSHHNIIHHMIGAGYRVYAMDLWGHGRSPGTRGVVHLQKAIQDHLELRKLVAKQEPDLPVILFGHSLGGLVTSGSTVADSTNVKGVVLTGPAFPGPLPYLARLALGAAATAMPKTSIPRKANVEGLTRDNQEIQKYWDDSMFHKDPISFLLAATALDAAQDVREGAKDWKAPTLVLHGNVDAYCDYKASERFVENIASADKEFGLYEEGRHELLHDLDGDAVLKRILGWIERHISSLPDAPISERRYVYSRTMLAFA